MIEPTAGQISVRDHAGLSLVVIAPAGCGKTEALALRVQGLLDRGAVPAPQRILVATFSNRARDNIKARLGAHLSPRALRERVTVANFHGLARRLYRAHANVIGVDPDWTLPTSDWIKQQCRSRDYDYPTTAAVERTLRVAKQKPRTDEELHTYLQRPGREAALALETLRVAERQVTYDDLLRYAELILANDQVARLYREHFGAVVVDEFQDLTPQQLRIVNVLGVGRTTFAGDLAQGIYGFTGATPSETFTKIQAECTDTVEFNESHRSSPAVLAAVNSLNLRTGGANLISASPESWPGGGIAAHLTFPDTASEAAWAAGVAANLLRYAPGHRVGIIARTAPRRRFTQSELDAKGIEYVRWDDGLLDSDTARVIRSVLDGFDKSAYNDASDKMAYLCEVADAGALTQTTGLDALVEALGWCHDLLREGVSPMGIRDRVREGQPDTVVTAPGVHLLTAHIGKGQQFDWVIILGLEEGILPDFRAETDEEKTEEARILSVMISRARHGVLLSTSRMVPTAADRPKARSASSLLPPLLTTPLMGRDALNAWFEAADWPALAVR